MAKDLLEAVRELSKRCEYEAALALCDDALAESQTKAPPGVWACRALVHRRMKLYDEAVADASAGLFLHPDDPELLFERSMSHAERHAFADAMADLNQILSQEAAAHDASFTETARLLVAVCLNRLERRAEALNVCARIAPETTIWVLGKLHTRNSVEDEAR